MAYKVTCRWKELHIHDYDIAVLTIDDTVVEVKFEERKPECYWVSFECPVRGSVKTSDIYECIADMLERFVEELKPLRMSFTSDMMIKMQTYKENLERRAPEYGYIVEERKTPDNPGNVVYTIVRVDGEKV